MKRIVLVRHAKAVPYGYENDFSRDLEERGRGDALLVSRAIERHGIHPDAIITSPASRALATAMIFAETFGFDISGINREQRIYDGLTTNEFLEIIQSTSETDNTLFFFGHNPDIHYFVHNLLISFDLDMPTCAAVAIEFRVNRWQEVQARTGKMVLRIIPKMVK